MRENFKFQLPDCANGSRRGVSTLLLGERKNSTGQQKFSLFMNRRLQILQFLPTKEGLVLLQRTNSK